MNVFDRKMVAAVFALGAGLGMPAAAAAQTTDAEPSQAEAAEATPPGARWRDAGAALDSQFEFLEFERQTGLGGVSFSDCFEVREPRFRERAVLDEVELDFDVDADGSVSVSIPGDEAATRCVQEAVDAAELDATPEAYRELRWSSWSATHTYQERQTTRHGEVAALYTLSAVGAGVGIGAFVSARNQESDLDQRDDLDRSNPSDRNLLDRPDRFRRAAWASIGVSIASFVGGTLLFERHRDIESRENPVLVATPVAPGADVGLSVTTLF